METNFFVPCDITHANLFKYKNKNYKITLYMNMHCINPSLNKIMANINFISYSNYLKNVNLQNRIPNTNVEVYFNSLEQQNFGQTIISQEYFNLLKDFLFTYPFIVCNRRMSTIYKIEKGNLQKANLIFYKVPIIIQKTENLDTEDKLINLIKKSTENYNSIQIKYLKEKFTRSLPSNYIYSIIDIETEHPDDYNIVNNSGNLYLVGNYKITLANEKKYLKTIFDKIKDEMIKTYGSKLNFMNNYLNLTRIYID